MALKTVLFSLLALFLLIGASYGANKLCDFEGTDECGFTIKASGVFNWIKATPKEHETDFIHRDHTLQSEDGHIMIASGSTAPDDAKTYLISPQQKVMAEAEQCLTFWYDAAEQANRGRLSVYLSRQRPSPTDEFKETPAWSVGEDFSASWEYGAVSVDFNADYYYMFEAANHLKSTFALDDIVVIDGKCSDPVSCDFEDGWCGWVDRDDPVRWKLHEGLSGTPTPGPVDDHTVDSVKGHYVYMAHDSSTVDAPLEAMIVSERVLFQPASVKDWCFTFWYHMYTDSGANDATLKLDLQEAGKNLLNLITINTQQENRWRKRISKITGMTADFRLLFTGSLTGKNKDNAIALDDLLLTSEPCPAGDPDEQKFDCVKGNVIRVPQSQVCDQKRDCQDGSDEADCGTCTFQDSHMCEYDPDTVNIEAFHWRIISPEATPPGGQKPKPYMIADFDRGETRADTYLSSPFLHETSATCKLEFYYFMESDNDTDAGTLIVRLKHLESQVTIAILEKTLLDNTTNVLAPNWKKHTVDIGRLGGEFQLTFHARKPSYSTTEGFIAIDRIEMLNCGFKETPQFETCPIGTSKCIATSVKSECVSDDARCDFNDDCRHGEDEEPVICVKSHPLRCDFEKSLCDWQIDTVAGTELKWTLGSGRTPTPHSGPLRDHTTGSATGGFIYLPSSDNAVDKNKVFTFSSTKWFEPVKKDDKCTLRFFLHMYGRTLGQLTIHLEDVSGGGVDLAEKYDENTGDMWVMKTVALESQTRFSVFFKGEIGGDNGDIAIDDVSFSNGCKVYVGPNRSTTTSKIPLNSSPRTEATVATPPAGHAGHLLVPHLNDIGGGAIAGIVLGVLAVLVIFAGVLVYLQRRRAPTVTVKEVIPPWIPDSYRDVSTLQGVTVHESSDGPGVVTAVGSTGQTDWVGFNQSNSSS